MATKLKSDFKEPAITGVSSVPAKSQQGVGDKITKGLETFANAFLSGREASERQDRKSIETINDLNITNAIGVINNVARDNIVKKRELGLQWIGGYTKEFPANERARTVARFNSLFNVSLGKSNEKLIEEIRTQGLANQNQLAVQESAILKSTGIDIFSDNPASREAAETELNFLRTKLIAQLSEQRTDAFGNTFSLFKPEDAAEIVQNFNDTFMGEGLIGWGKNFPSTAEALLALIDGGPEVSIPSGEVVSRKTINEQGVEVETLEPEMITVRAMNTVSDTKGKEIITLFTSKLGIENQIRERVETAANKKQKTDWDNEGSALIQNLYTAPEGKRKTPDEIRLMGLAGDLDSSKVEDYIKLAVAPRPEFDNPELVKSFAVAVEAGVDISELLADPIISSQFKPETFASFVEDNQSNLDVAAGINEGPLKNEISAGLTLLKSSIQTGGVGGTLGMVFQADNKAVLRRAEAVRLYQLRTATTVDPETGRIAPPLENPTDVAIDLIKRGLTDFMTTGAGGDLLLPLGYKGTREKMSGKDLTLGVNELQKRLDKGVINKKVFDKNSILYAKWFGLLPEIFLAQQPPETDSAKKGTLPSRRTE